MKFNPITKKDVENIVTREYCYKIINEQVNAFEEKVSDEVFGAVCKTGEFNEDDMDESYLKLFKLESDYSNTDNWIPLLFMHSMFLISGVSALRGKPELHMVIVAILLISVCSLGITKSIHNAILRRKINKNLKEFNLE